MNKKLTGVGKACAAHVHKQDYRMSGEPYSEGRGFLAGAKYERARIKRAVKKLAQNGYRGNYHIVDVKELLLVIIDGSEK